MRTWAVRSPMSDRPPDHDLVLAHLRQMRNEMRRMELKVPPGAEPYTVADVFAQVFKSMAATVKAHREFLRIESEMAKPAGVIVSPDEVDPAVFKEEWVKIDPTLKPGELRVGDDVVVLEGPCPEDPGGQHFIGCGCVDVDLGFDSKCRVCGGNEEPPVHNAKCVARGHSYEP